MTIRFQLVSPTATIPFRNGKAAGFDLYSCEAMSVQPGCTVKCPIGVAFDVPENYEGQIRGRSGNALRGWQVVLGTLDCDFTDPVSAILYNASRELWPVRIGDRVAQVVFSRIELLDMEPCTGIASKGRGPGWGSSGTGRVPGNGG